MDNRGFPTAGGESKAGFPYPAMNGGYPAMCYPGQEMMLPYGQYGAGPDTQFNEQCAVRQQVPQGAAPYGFGAQAQQYMQHYRQQAHFMQAAYSTAQHQNRVSNPQQIADSIYMAAHAYNYQQQNPSLPQAPNSYSPGGGGSRTALSVRTGPSPANSLHSPAGSTQSLGERPMLSPRAQSNAQMYNSYHQTNNHPPNNRTVPTQQQHQQPHVQSINYYTNGSNHPTHPNGCMSAELDHRRSVERLASISHPSEQFNHAQEINSPSHTTNTVAKSQYYQPPVTASVSMAAPVNACQHRTDLSKTRRQRPPPNRKQPVAAVSSPNRTNQSAFQSKPIVTSPGEPKTPASCVRVTAATQPVINNEPVVSNAVNKGTETAEDDRPKEAAIDSGIDSEQIDKDNDEEHDTSTTSNKSETSPHPPKLTEANSELDQPSVGSSNQSQADRGIHEVTGTSSSLATAEGYSVAPPLGHKHSSSLTVATSTVLEQPRESASVATPTAIATSADGESNATNDSDSKDSSSIADHRNTEYDQLNSSLQQSDLSDSFGSQLSSFSSSGASKQSIGDESRLPPRKRKQQLSEHTQSFKAAMPIKKRGRPSKEVLKLREAAKLAEVVEPASREDNFSHKERKHSFSSNKGKEGKLKNPIHSGNLLHSPKLNLGAKEEKSTDQPSSDSANNKVETDKASSMTVNDGKEDAALPLKSNAVLISPPSKPKARVSAMQKALQLVSNDPTGEVFLPRRKKRGRPLGSKNRKTKGDMRARSNSVGSSGKGQLMINFAGEDGREGAGNDPSATGGSNGNSNTSSNVTSQSHRMSLSVQNRKKSLHYRKNKSLSPKSSTNATEPVLPTSTDAWVCIFCQHVSNFRNLGDLFGGYNIQPRTPVAAKVVPHRKTSDLRFQQLLDKKCRPNEIWFHERCIIWSPGVYMLGGNLYGVYEAIVAAFQTTCSSCMKNGAILGCFCKGCTQRYHLHCAEAAECALNEENFSMLCTKHKDKKIVLM